ncbi:hypothetical protein CPU12_11370 [Malaciobacter molluscorum LMG 25693]|uniref:Motility accessory factor n=1 Tax=Malaciobacter molluscorum LMG 25693 TaxID=870501 RepID=A0A2G1DFN5_9BACT|nr:6-hydroxymethylpterin diphosphokinase MptE-like protein [Malaciobacter molluscorum]AXX93544.1 motility accessory factor [Malaciobacter molluscorum LMG 25693]PHO17301.1 hypothetical protein CPU12_11370 [Malaciobacter molluscorum LMG 25693]
MQELEELTQLLFKLYKKNLEFLKNNHPKVYKKVQDLSNELDNKKRKERYTLEYIEKGGYFDVLDHNTDKYIYDFNSYKEADKRAEITDFTRDSSLNLLRIDTITNKLALMGSLGVVTTLVNYINHKVDFSNITFSKIFKFIFIGVGSGVHLNEVYKKIDSMNTLIIEPDIELFRISLFTADYTLFEEGNKKLFLSVGENEIEREETLADFSYYHNYMNYNIKHHLFWIEYKYILDQIIDFFGNNSATSFPFDAVLNVLERTTKFMRNKELFLKNSLVQKNAPLKNKKVLIISAGPSLDKNIDWIKQNQDKFVIICVDVILRKLEKNNIIPDIVVSIDPSYLCGEYLTTENKDFLKNSAIIFLSQQEESVLEKVKHLNYYFSQVFPLSKELGYSFSLPNVGTFSFAIAIFLKANEIYLVGNDAAFNQETGSRYASDSSHKIKDFSHDEKYEKDDTLISSYDIIEVKGNFKDKIKSNRILLTFKKDYESYLFSLDEKVKKSLKAYNLSDGAYMEGLIPLKKENIDLSKFTKKEFNVNNVLQSISCEVKDLDFKDDAKILTKMITRVNKFKKIKVNSRDDLLAKKLDIMIWILEQKKTMSSEIFGNVFLKFIELIDIYVNFFLNLRQNALYDKKNLMEIKSYWCDSTIYVLKYLKHIINQE